MPRVNYVKSARKDHKEAGVKKGESYYWWSVRVGRGSYKKYSKTRPTRSQLTSSDIKAQAYDIIDNATVPPPESWEDLRNFRDDQIQALEDLKTDVEDRLAGMPEQLQDSSVLNEYRDEIDNAIDEYSGIDLDGDDDIDPDDEDAVGDNESELQRAVDDLAGVDVSI